jgi:hypothetical protein
VPQNGAKEVSARRLEGLYSKSPDQAPNRGIVPEFIRMRHDPPTLPLMGYFLYVGWRASGT